MIMIRLLLWITIVAVFVAGFLPLITFAQGCPMCKSAAAAQSEQAAKSLNRAILLLLVPPVTIMSSILFFAFRYRDTPPQPIDACSSSKEPPSARSD
jgi:hypothetical protein